ncbi:MAG: hypothetical protein P9X24_00215, partial [Candidatus Hatepunaea meridiana]|nr:hypothetical protein [Candidatus Hatepunaea meridiana]
MLKLLILLATAIVKSLRNRQQLILENLFLSQQLVILKRNQKRPRLQNSDRILLVWISRMLNHWKQVLVVVNPETVIRWHKKG